MKKSPGEFPSPNQRIARLLFWHHFIVLMTPFFYFMFKGFDFEEVMVTSLVPLAATIILGFFYLFDISLAPPHCSTPSDKNMWVYFGVMMFFVSSKAFVPNIVNFYTMMIIIIATEAIFDHYLWKIGNGVGRVDPRETPGAKVRPD